MAGFSKLYVIGEEGGYQGADGVNPIEFMVLVGDASRQWLEPHYFDATIEPLGNLRTLIPGGSHIKDALLDACIAFCPRFFGECKTLNLVRAQLGNEVCLDFDRNPEAVPAAWATLREEARHVFKGMKVWQAELTPVATDPTD